MMLVAWFLLLQIIPWRAAAVAPPSICIDADGFASVSISGCPDGNVFRIASANAFNILWSVWTPTGVPHPPHLGNWSTSFQTLEQLHANNLTFARVFGSPWGWKDILLWQTSPLNYWQNMSKVLEKAKALGVRLHISITPTLQQFAIAANCSGIRELITNTSNRSCYVFVKKYVQEMVSRYKDDSTVLTWGMGNELNLQADGCSYNKSASEYFSTDEMMEFSRRYVSWVKEIDPKRPLGSDMGLARTRAKHLAGIPGGGRACVSPTNPKGDCEDNCTAVPRDTLQDFKEMMAILSEPFDFVSAHIYGCYPPFARFSFCDGDNTSIAPLKAAKEVADRLGKPLFVGEFGAPACVKNGWASEECLAFPRKLLQYQVGV